MGLGEGAWEGGGERSEPGVRVPCSPGDNGKRKEKRYGNKITIGTKEARKEGWKRDAYPGLGGSSTDARSLS